MKKQTVFVPISAKDELPPTNTVVTFLENNGEIYQDKSASWDKDVTNYSWLDEQKDKYVLSEDELKKLLADAWGMGGNRREAYLSGRTYGVPTFEEFLTQKLSCKPHD